MSYKNFRQMISEKLAHWLFPRLANFCLNSATGRARRRFARQGRPKILLDNTVRGLAVTHETRWVYEENRGYQARVPVHRPDNKSLEYKQLTYLTSIAHLARMGFVELYTSGELDDERFRQPAGRYTGYGYSDYSLFGGLKIKRVDELVLPVMGPKAWNLPSAAEQQRARIEAKNDPLFNQIYDLMSKQLGPKCRQDCWHIRTAEKYNMYALLRTDRSLLKSYGSLKHKKPLSDIGPIVVDPIELAKIFGVSPVPPILLSYNNADWFVRIDQAMPNEKRRNRRDYG